MQKVTIELLNDHALNLLQELEQMSIIRFTKSKKDNTASPILSVKKQRQFGAMKGLVVYMADDFDSPLEDFKEYM